MEPTSQTPFEADSALVAAMADGDRDALGRLYDRYASMIMGVVLRILGDRREAEDLVHDVFLEAWVQSRNYDARRGGVRTWLLIRARCRAIDRRRSARISRSVPLEPGRFLDELAGNAGIGDVPERVKVREAVAALPPEQRAVLELGYFEGLTSSEISQRVAVPVGTVKSRVAAALARLRAGLGLVREEQ